MEREKVIFNWSGGKDSSLALFEIKEQDKFEIATLLTTVNKDYERISMHGIHEDLLEEQRRNLKLSLQKVYLSAQSSNEEYSQSMYKILNGFKDKGIHKAVFGDIYLEDIRRYREDQLSQVEMQAIFPLWNQDTHYLASRFVDLGFKAIITCVDTEAMPKEFAGETYDQYFLENLPDSVDPCGENGEFHTLVYEGPIFENPIGVSKGEKILRDSRFFYCDVLSC